VPGSRRRAEVDSGDISAPGSDDRPPVSRSNSNSSSSSSSAVRGAAVYPPRSVFRPTPSNITVSPGDRAVLKCRVENLGTKTVSIYSILIKYDFSSTFRVYCIMRV